MTDTDQLLDTWDLITDLKERLATAEESSNAILGNLVEKDAMYNKVRSDSDSGSSSHAGSLNTNGTLFKSFINGNYIGY